MWYALRATARSSDPSGVAGLQYWVIILEKDEKKIETDVEEIEDAESLVLTIQSKQIRGWLYFSS